MPICPKEHTNAKSKVYYKEIDKPVKKLVRAHIDFAEWRYWKVGTLRAYYWRQALAECGTHFQVYGKPVLYEPEKIHIGNHVTLNNGIQISPRAHVYLGDYVTMSRGSQIVAGSLDMNCWVDEKYKKRIHTEGEVRLGEGTWLCINSIVLPGVNISGKGVVVAAGAIVTHDITEDYVVVAGAPARIVKRLK